MVDAHLTKQGKIAYIEIPALDATVSAAFFEAVFGFRVSHGSVDRVGFEDGPRDLIGAFTCGRTVSPDSGVVPWIHVTSVAETLQLVVANGCEVNEAPHPEDDTLLATFHDPAGNLIGVWEAI